MFSKQPPNKNGESTEPIPLRTNGPLSVVTKRKEFEGITSETLRLVIDSMDDKVDVEKFDSVQKKEFNQQIHDQLDIVLKDSHRHLSYGDKQKVVQYVVDEMFGFGPINSLVLDPNITEIMVNSFNNIYVEMGGRLTKSDISFRDNAHVLHIINKIINPIGRRIDESCPSVDARLPDGSRVNAIIPPLALKGPSITIRKFSATPLKTDDLISYGTLTGRMAEFIQACVRGRLNIIVSGGTGSGKTTTLNTLSSYIPDTERIVTIEDTAELQLHQDHVVTLESRNANIEGKGEYTIRELVRNSLRMRPDRIVIGEVRGGEALDMLQAMNTGHDGSISTLHANNPREALARLETMVLMAGMDLPLRAIREQVAAAIDIIIHQARLNDGSRKIVKITEVLNIGKEGIEIQELFSFKQTGVDSQGLVIGEHAITGCVPKCLDRLASYGENIRDSFPEWHKTDTEASVEEVKETAEKEVIKVVYVKEESRQVVEPLPPQTTLIQEPVTLLEAPVKEERSVAYQPLQKGNMAQGLMVERPETKKYQPLEGFVDDIPFPDEGLEYFVEPQEEVSVDEYYQLLLADEKEQEEISVAVVAPVEIFIPKEEVVREIEKPEAEEPQLVEQKLLLLGQGPEPMVVQNSKQEEDPEEESDFFGWRNYLQTEDYSAEMKDYAERSLGEQPVEAVLSEEDTPAAHEEIAEKVWEAEKVELAEEVPHQEETITLLAAEEIFLPKLQEPVLPEPVMEVQEEKRLDSFVGSKAKTVPFRRGFADLLDLEMVSSLGAVCSGPDKAEVGQTVTFVVSVSNKSDVEDLSKIVITGNKFDITRKINFLPAGQSRTLEINYTIKETDYPKLENKIIIFALNEFGEELVCEKKCVIAILKPEIKVLNEGPDTAKVGEVITYTIVVNNTGKVALSHVVVTDSKQDWTQKLDTLAAGLSQTYEAKYTVTEDDYPTLESIVTVRARNSYGKEVSAEDMHNVFVVYEEEEPEIEEKPMSRVMGVVHGESCKEAEHSNEPPVEREERPASLASLIPENMRGVSLLMNEITALSGLVQSGDRVDVYLISADKETNRKEANHNIIENAIFLKENRVPGEKRERAVVLAVTPEQAEQLATAYAKGTFYLVLRSSQEEENKSPWQSRLVVG